MALGAAQDDARELGEIDTVHVCQGGGGGALGYKGIGPCVCAPGGGGGRNKLSQ